MSKIAAVVQQLHRSEQTLAAMLLRISDQHRADHEIHHLSRDLARWSRQHVAELGRVGSDYGLDLDPRSDTERAGPDAEQVEPDTDVGLRAEPTPLLADLRQLHLAAVEASLDWELLAQVAQARKDPGLLAVAKSCHPETLRQARWANAKLKEISAQLLLS